MIDPTNNSARVREKPEPHEQSGGIPRYLLVLIVLLVCWGFFYINVNPYQRQFDDASITKAVDSGIDGEQLYNNSCAGWHQTHGQGLAGVFPPLANSEWVTGDERLVVQILLHGLSGEIKVAGVDYNGMMPAFGTNLTDVELAAVSSYVRNTWGNSATVVDMETVAKERAAQADRANAWTARELHSVFGTP